MNYESTEREEKDRVAMGITGAESAIRRRWIWNRGKENGCEWVDCLNIYAYLQSECGSTLTPSD
jgi:hypothetical protein